VLEHEGMVEVVSSLQRDGTPIPNDIRKGVWVCFRDDSDYIKNCFEEYQVTTDPSGRYMTLFKKWHLIGLELAYSVASIGLRGEATGVARHFNGDVVALAKRGLKAGEILDGEGGYTVSGGLRPARASVEAGMVPLGLAHNVKLLRDVPDGQPVTWSDVEADTGNAAYKLRREMEKAVFG
jgi:predicted homoserine dehydrogenase-like protein